MIRLRLLELAVLGLSAPTWAQSVPRPSPDNPRVQSVPYETDRTVQLIALPRSTLTVMLDPSEVIERVAVATRDQFDVSVSSERNALHVTSLSPDAATLLSVETDTRTYRFEVETGEGLMAAYLVQFDYGVEDATPEAASVPSAESSTTWNYRLSGDRSVRPDAIVDDGLKTRITFDPSRALPAIFAIGPTGEEEVVNGFMRDRIFEIDRVYDELVFRIDKDKAKARRNAKPEREG